MATTPHIKFEHSPVESLAESFDSIPGQSYPSLFHSIDSSESMNTPRSFDDEDDFGDSLDGSNAGTPAPEKKPVKKRKSWGQQLPEPKTNLPPRKRAKTEDEKEQRRVERVLRNRRAAQSSRERKRQEVEALEAQKMAVERRNQDLEMRLAAMEAHNAVLLDEVKRLGGNSNMHFFQGSSSPEQIRSSPTPVTFSQQLFTSQDQDMRPISTQSIHGSPVQTVNPASLSPEIRPVAESTNASSSDMTQHPAAMLCDLQCQSEEQRPWMDTTSTASAISQILATTLLVTMISEVTSTLLSPLSQIINSLSTGSPLSPTTSILTLIIWLTTTTASLKTSTSTTSSTTTSPRPRFSLRIRLLRRLLTCSPNLARPLMDATVVAMRSASEQQLSQVCLSSTDASRHVQEGPSIEVLTTLLWAIQSFEKERKQKLMTTEMDASSEVRQACEELAVLFTPREMKMGKRRVAYGHGRGVGSLGERLSQKSLDGWRTEFRP